MGPSRIGVVDGFNLYHGGTSRFAKALGRLEVVRTPRPCIGSRHAPISIGSGNDSTESSRPESPAPRTPLGQVDQEISIRARLANGSIDHVNIGYDITHMENGPLARLDSTRGTSFEYIDNTG